MKKNQVEISNYLAPWCEVIELDNELTLLAGSPPGNPDNHGGTEVVKPKEDDEDTDISGAKAWNGLWDEE